MTLGCFNMFYRPVVVIFVISSHCYQSYSEKPGRGWCSEVKKPDRHVGNRKGYDARPNEYPWLVSVRKDHAHVCGGSIVTSRYVLTAAHCLFNKHYERIPNELFRVIAGAHKTDWDADESSRQIRKVSKVIIADHFTEIQTDVDLALIKVDHPFHFNKKVSPICIAKERPAVNTRCIVAGWGATKGTSTSKVLQRLHVPIIADETCNRPDWYRFGIKPFEMCAGFAEGGKDSCYGDSGGPLMCKKDHIWIQAGVVSWGVDCAKAKQPGVYTDLSHPRAQSWILKHAKLDTNPPVVDFD